MGSRLPLLCEELKVGGVFLLPTKSAYTYLFYDVMILVKAVLFFSKT
jgi:hypothetical protein